MSDYSEYLPTLAPGTLVQITTTNGTFRGTVKAPDEFKWRLVDQKKEWSYFVDWQKGASYRSHAASELTVIKATEEKCNQLK
jgi:hypothetical protein